MRICDAVVVAQAHAVAGSMHEHLVDLVGVLRQCTGGKGYHGIGVVVGGVRPAVESCLTNDNAVGPVSEGHGAGDGVTALEVVSGGGEVGPAGFVNRGQQR